jgi:hypothetical protein
MSCSLVDRPSNLRTGPKPKGKRADKGKRAPNGARFDGLGMGWDSRKWLRG